MKLDKETQQLFKFVRTKLGAPIRTIQLTDDQLYDLLQMCVADYAKEIQDWLAENQWSSLYGKEISTTDFTYALTVRTMDFATDYSFWFSKEVGLQQRGDKWELKKDYIELELGKQSYLIPAGRELNKVLYCTPPTSMAAVFSNFAGLDVNFGSGSQAQFGANNGAGGMGFYMAPAFDALLIGADMNLKGRMLRSDLTYKVTAGPNGTKIIHFLSTPGSPFSFMGMPGLNSLGNSYGLSGSYVWYTYYETKGKNNLDNCRKQNPNILLTPDQVPFDKMEFSFLNEPTKTLIRQWLVAEAKILLGIIRGTNSGKISIPDAELQLDYTMLLTQGREEKEHVIKSLTERLNGMKPENIMKKNAEMAESLNNVLKYKPLAWKII